MVFSYMKDNLHNEQEIEEGRKMVMTEFINWPRKVGRENSYAEFFSIQEDYGILLYEGQLT